MVLECLICWDTVGTETALALPSWGSQSSEREGRARAGMGGGLGAQGT